MKFLFGTGLGLGLLVTLRDADATSIVLEKGFFKSGEFALKLLAAGGLNIRFLKSLVLGCMV